MDGSESTDSSPGFESWLSSTCVAFRALTPRQRTDAMVVLLEQCTPEELWAWHNRLADRLCRDLIGWLPAELALHVLGYLDVRSLFRAASVSSLWRRRVDSAPKLWRRQADLLGGRRLNREDAQVQV